MYVEIGWLFNIFVEWEKRSGGGGGGGGDRRCEWWYGERRREAESQVGLVSRQLFLWMVGCFCCCVHTRNIWNFRILGGNTKNEKETFVDAKHCFVRRRVSDCDVYKRK